MNPTELSVILANANIPWPLVHSVVSFVFVIADIVLVWFIARYARKALSYRPKIDLRILPPNIAEILKHVGAREKFARRWGELCKSAVSAPPNSYRDAIVGADALIDELLIEAGFGGRDAAERFGALNRLGLRHGIVNGLFEAHRLRNKIAHEASFVPSARVTEKALKQYERFLIEAKIVV